MITLQRQLTIFGDLNPCQLPLHHMQMFLVIAEAGNCTYQELMDCFHLSNASVSRSVNALGTDPRHRIVGLGLVERYPDPHEGRRYRVRLTKKGKLIYDQIRDA